MAEKLTWEMHEIVGMPAYNGVRREGPVLPSEVEEHAVTQEEADEWCRAVTECHEGRTVASEPWAMAEPAPRTAGDRFEYTKGVCYLAVAGKAPDGKVLDKRYVIQEHFPAEVVSILLHPDGRVPERNVHEGEPGHFVVNSFRNMRFERFICKRAEESRDGGPYTSPGFYEKEVKAPASMGCEVTGGVRPPMLLLEACQDRGTPQPLGLFEGADHPELDGAISRAFLNGAVMVQAREVKEPAFTLFNLQSWRDYKTDLLERLGHK